MPKDRRRTSSNYRKPPVKYQFKKGKSGNPKGRPRKKSSGNAIVDRFSRIALNEATRLITVREGDKVSEMPALQALFRTMFRAAAQGDTRAGRQLLEVIARAESGRVAEAREIVEFATQYKENSLKTIENYEQHGLEPPEIYPHPDDLIINEETGEIRIEGPRTKEEAGARKAVRQRALELVGRYFEVEEALKRDPSNRALRQELRELKKYYDFLMDDAAQNLRRKALRLSREALQQPEQAEPEDNNSDET
jgi:hypothetical protein